jgi:hypothetical protein
MKLINVKKTVECFQIFDYQQFKFFTIFDDFITLAVPSLAATRWVVLPSIHEVTEAPVKEIMESHVQHIALESCHLDPGSGYGLDSDSIRSVDLYSVSELGNRIRIQEGKNDPQK